MLLADERGDVVLGGLRGTVVALAVIAVVLFEIGAVVVNVFQLDDLGGRAAVAAATAWRDTRTGPAVLAAVEDVVAGQAEVAAVEISADAGTVAVSLRRSPAVMVLDLVPPVRDRLHATVTQQAVLEPRGL